MKVERLTEAWHYAVVLISVDHLLGADRRRITTKQINKTNSMRVILKKRLDDAIFMGMDHDILEMNPLSKAITRRYLPRWSPSPLQALLLKKLGTLKPMYLYLTAECEENYEHKTIKKLRLALDIQDDVDRWTEQVGINKVDWDSVMDCVRTYFQSIGYEDTACDNDREIARFVKRLTEDIPLAAEYFEVQCQYEESDIARIGFFGENDEYEVYVKTDDEWTAPHFHVRDSATKGGELETCILIGESKYCPHGSGTDVLAPEQQHLLMDFMGHRKNKNSRAVPYTCEYACTVDMWNCNNDTAHAELRHDENGEVIIPDYAHIQ